MNERQFDDWIIAYRKWFLESEENWDFLMEWRRQLDQLDFVDAVEALNDVALDPRGEARFPRQHLRLIVEHAKRRRLEREEKSKPKIAWGPRQPMPDSWNKKMLAMGIIDQAKYERRKEALLSGSQSAQNNSNTTS